MFVERRIPWYNIENMFEKIEVWSMSKLSNRQQAIIDFIRKEVRDKGYPPSVREIGEAVGLASSSTVHGHLARLEKKGLIAAILPSPARLSC